MEAFQLINKPLIVEDTGLLFNAWNGLPGALSKWFLETVGTEGLVKMLDNYSDKSAKAITKIGFYDGVKLEVFQGEVVGTIVEPRWTDNRFGWNEIFQPIGSNKTYAEITIEQKNKNSMRKKAVEKLLDFLKKNQY